MLLSLCFLVITGRSGCTSSPYAFEVIFDFYLNVTTVCFSFSLISAWWSQCEHFTTQVSKTENEDFCLIGTS